MSQMLDAVVVGGGQAGLVGSRALSARALDHVVLERDQVAERWRSARWDSLRFQFPNEILGLPGMPYDGPDPHGFARHDEVLRWLERYAGFVDAPIEERTPVTSVHRETDGWHVLTADSELLAHAVLVATGPFQSPRIPTLSADLPDGLVQLHSVDYRNPDLLPVGSVLVVGSGASGAQIAEELVAAGRTTYLCVSRHRRVPRRFLGRDIMSWLADLGLMDRTRNDWIDGRMPPTVLVTGVDGGHDLDVRELGEQGATLLGSLCGVDGDTLHFADDVEQILAAADAMYDELMVSLVQRASDVDQKDPVPKPRPRPGPVPHRSTMSLHDAGITSVIWSTGYSFDYGWLHAPCLDAHGAPVQQRGVSEVGGLYFLGLHWMHTFKSGTFLGIADDASYVADHMATYVRGH